MSATGSCLEQDCGESLWEHGLCKRHFLVTEAAERAERTRFWKPNALSYRAMHQALRKFLGPAARLPCVDCDRRARDWSYMGGDPNERMDLVGVFSSDPKFYVPRCPGCHKRYDVGVRKSAA